MPAAVSSITYLWVSPAATAVGIVDWISPAQLSTEIWAQDRLWITPNRLLLGVCWGGTKLATDPAIVR